MPILWIDIETIPGEEKPALEEIAAPKNYKDPEKIRAYQEENQDKEWREQALHSAKGRLLCISWAQGNAPTICRGIWDNSEHAILSELDSLVSDIAIDGLMWGGFNLKSFDLNWIWQRGVKYGFAGLCDWIERGRYPKNVLDVRDLWTGGDPYGKGKLSDIAKFLGIPMMDMDGSQVLDLYLNEDFEKIAQYCREDVETTREIAWRMGVGNPPAKTKTAATFAA